MRLPTGSSLGRVIKCSASALLPQVNSLNAAAEEGTAAHDYVRAYLNGTDFIVPKQYEEFCRGIQLDRTRGLPRGAIQEPAFGFDFSTASVMYLGCNIGRSYPKAENSFFGSADVVIVDGPATRVIDFKFGRNLIVARGNWQLKLLALCVAKHYNVNNVTVEIWQGQALEIDSHEIDEFELIEIEEELQALGKKLKAGRQEIVEGEHCRYCPAMNFCPAKVAMLRGLLEGKDVLTANDLASTYKNMRVAESVIKKVKDNLFALARENDIDLGNGKVFGMGDFKLGERKK